MLQASAISTAHRLMCRSVARAVCSDRWVNASVKPVRAATSRISSGRSTRGSRPLTFARKVTRESGSSSLSSAVSTSSVLSPTVSNRTAGFCGSLVATAW